MDSAQFHSSFHFLEGWTPTKIEILFPGSWIPVSKTAITNLFYFPKTELSCFSFAKHREQVKTGVSRNPKFLIVRRPQISLSNPFKWVLFFLIFLKLNTFVTSRVWLTFWDSFTITIYLFIMRGLNNLMLLTIQIDFFFMTEKNLTTEFNKDKINVVYTGSEFGGFRVSVKRQIEQVYSKPMKYLCVFLTPKYWRKTLYNFQNIYISNITCKIYRFFC